MNDTSENKEIIEYTKKRDFQKTPEPEWDKKPSSGKPLFVIQKHDATNLHYDLRLEIEGVLVSWAVPKGPSTDPSQKRLAMRTEDHPMGYDEFEGIIPKDQYGGGTVIIWDRGKYDNIRGDKDGDGATMEKSLKDGKIEVDLHGEKLQGSYILIRTGKQSGKERWLFFKGKDDHADARRNPVSTEPESVKSGLTIEKMREKYEKSRGNE